MISAIASSHTQRGMGHNSCYTPIRIGTVAGGSGSMETAIVRILNAVLYPEVF